MFRAVSQTETTKYEVVEEVEEMRTKGTVSSQVFRSYMTAGGHWTSMMFLLLMFCLTQFIGSAGDYWLNYWVNLEEYVYHREPNSTTLMPDYPFYLSQTWCIVVFTLLIGATIIVSLVRSFLFFYMCMRSSMWLHNTMFSSITRATMRFFHTNPSANSFSPEELLRCYVDTSCKNPPPQENTQTLHPLDSNTKQGEYHREQNILSNFLAKSQHPKEKHKHQLKHEALTFWNSLRKTTKTSLKQC
ncbi:hypothetical protein J6590_054248 [Homalodisca vitripennis]|nr:hypothetical protein J6590_054248 [Homalodisca vitripennis]